mgnify:CR=1 FL=1
MECKVFGNIRYMGRGKVLVSGDYYVLGTQTMNTVTIEIEADSIAGLTANQVWDLWAASLCQLVQVDTNGEVLPQVTDVIWV